MELEIFTVLDSKGAFFDKPWYEMSEASAIRAFSDGVNHADEKNMYYVHPEDYTLYKIGSFDNTLGEIKPIIPKALVTASALKDSYKEKKLPQQLELIGSENNKTR